MTGVLQGELGPIEFLNRFESSASRDRSILADPPVFAGGQGARVWDTEGRAYVDFFSGPAVSNAGHGNRDIAEAIKAQVDSGLLQVGSSFVAAGRSRLIEAILAVCPSGLNRVQFAVSGADAVEAALKIVRAKTGRMNVIAFWGAYHGRTLGALALTGYRSYRDPVLPTVAGVHHIPYPYAYRNPFGLPRDNAGQVGDTILNYLEHALQSPASGLPPIGAVVVEPIQGVGGMVVPPSGFLSGLRDLCDRHGLLLISDEVFCGFGRSGNWFGCERDAVLPDLLVLGKGLSGALPISAVVGRDELMGDLPTGFLSSTYEANPLTVAAATASIEYLQSIDAPRAARQIGGVIEAALRGLADDRIGEVRGAGAMWGLELIDPETRAPDRGLALELQRECLRRGLLVYHAGAYGNVIGVLPPLVATEADLSAGLAILSRAMLTV